MKIIETDNFGGDYPNESFLNLPKLSKADADAIAEAINDSFSEEYPLFWKVVDDDYVLSPGFEP